MITNNIELVNKSKKILTITDIENYIKGKFIGECKTSRTEDNIIAEIYYCCNMLVANGSVTQEFANDLKVVLLEKTIFV